MDVFSPDRDVDGEVTFACTELERINTKSNDSNDITESPESTSPASTPTSNITNTTTVNRPASVTNRKRSYSLLLQGNLEHANQQGGTVHQQQQQRLQVQPTQQIVVHQKPFVPQISNDHGNQAVYQHTALVLSTPKQKIPRPPNAFMLFANEWRKKLAVQYPRESNKDISVRLGAMWKTMQKVEKERYFTLAREVDAEHKRKYPDYVYNPKEARMRKALREQSRETRNQMSRCHSAILPGSGARQQHQQWGSKAHHQSFPPGIGGRQLHNRQGLVSPRMLADQQRNLEETKKSIREQVEQGMIQGYTETFLDIEAIPYHQLNHMNLPSGGDYVIAEIDGQQWLPYMQPAQAGTSYMMRSNEDVKLQQGSPWSQYTADVRAQQVSSFPMRQQVMNGSYGNCLPNQHMMDTSNSNQQTTMVSVGQTPNRTDRASSNTDGNIVNGMQHQQYIYQQQQEPVATSNLAQNTVSKDELSREERMQMLELIPTSSANSDPLAVASTSTAVTTTTTISPKSEHPSTASNSEITSTSQSKNSKMSIKSQSITDIASALNDSTTITNGTENSNGPLPAFEQAFGCTEIGRYSHEGFFNNATQQNEHQQSTNNQNTDPKSIPNGTNQSDIPQGTPDDFPSPATPTMIFSPTNKNLSGEGLMSPPGWPLYFYSPGGSTTNQKSGTTLENGQRPNMPQHPLACFESPQFSHPSFAAYFDYALLSGSEFISGTESETILVGIPPGSGFGEGNELQVALDGGGSTVFASGNTYRDNEAGLDYVTLHIPANAITNNETDPLEITNEDGERIILSNDKDLKTDSEIIYEGLEDHTTGKQRKIDDNFGHSFHTIMINEPLTKENKEEKKECEKDKKEDDLERQDLSITGIREPIVISQTERICVLMNTPAPGTDGKEFTSL